MDGQDNYENIWKLIQLANEERLEEENRVHMAKLTQQSKPRSASPLGQHPAPFSERVFRTATAVLALVWN